MIILRGGSKGAQATAWVAPDPDSISGTGTGTVTSNPIHLYFNTLPDLADIPMIEVSFAMQKLTGTGWANAWTHLSMGHLADKAVSGSVAPNLVTGALWSISYKYRRILIKPLILQKSLASDFADCLSLYVNGKGTEADTGWFVLYIKARLIYVPL